MLNIILSIAKIQHIQQIQTLEATHYIKKTTFNVFILCPTDALLLF